MANIKDLLSNMMNAVYGKDLRQSIHDSIKQCHSDIFDAPGYYVPTVTDGVLSWTPTRDHMPSIPDADIVRENN